MGHRKGEVDCEDCTQIVLLKRDVSKHEEENHLLKKEFAEVSREVSKIDRFEIILEVIKDVIQEMKQASDENSNKLNELIMVVHKEQMRTEEALRNVETSLERLNQDTAGLKEALDRVISPQEREALGFACKLKSSLDRSFAKVLAIGLLFSVIVGAAVLAFMTLSKWLKVILG